MDTESQLLTTFDTPWRHYCFLKLPFRLCESQYFFQFYIDLNFKSINKGTHIIANDVLIVGNGKETQAKLTDTHDYQLLQVLNKSREISLKLNADKCTFKSSQVLFYGHLVSNVGLKADSKKVELIVHMPIP